MRHLADRSYSRLVEHPRYVGAAVLDDGVCVGCWRRRDRDSTCMDCMGEGRFGALVQCMQRWCATVLTGACMFLCRCIPGRLRVSCEVRIEHDGTSRGGGASAVMSPAPRGVPARERGRTRARPSRTVGVIRHKRLCNSLMVLLARHHAGSIQRRFSVRTVSNVSAISASACADRP